MILRINGVDMPIPIENGFTIGEQKIWSQNAGRNNRGTSIGTIITIKKTIEIEFPPLNHSQVKLINEQVSNVSLPYVSVYYDSELNDGLEFDGTCYFDSIAVPVMGVRNGKTVVTGYKLSAIEK